MKTFLFRLFLLGAAGLLAAGCRTGGGAYPPKNANNYSAEDRDKFVLLDARVQRSVTCAGLQERLLEDGRLEVTANVRNRESRRIQVQIHCVFKNELGFGAGDETPFQNLILSENAQESVRFVSMNNQAKKYTVRVQAAR